ncbi:hypothetical protein B0H14DRAFT_3524181 [Mycena olivaceomarginata]|nr:hypothetical protein B0H14DRAFT_3524181 [Mycena olivaceomarginata]
MPGPPNVIERVPHATRNRKTLSLTLLLIAVVIILIEAFHVDDKIVNALIPVTRWLHQTRAGWLIPIVVLIAPPSLPPRWGLGAGFGIIAAGTLIGERYARTSSSNTSAVRAVGASSLERALRHARALVREGGLPIAVLVRYSSFPAHFTTAVFSTCGMAFWVFLVAAVVVPPKQLVRVVFSTPNLLYTSVVFFFLRLHYHLPSSPSLHSALLLPSSRDLLLNLCLTGSIQNNLPSSVDDSKSNKIQHIVLGVTIVVTVIFMLYIRRLMKSSPRWCTRGGSAAGGDEFTRECNDESESQSGVVGREEETLETTGNTTNYLSVQTFSNTCNDGGPVFISAILSANEKTI